MKNLTKFFGIAVIWTVIVSVLSVAGCATSVPIKSVRPPTINTSGMQRLAIGSFENKSGIGGVLGAQLIQYLSDQSRQIITNSGNFTIVAPNDPNADGVFTGEIRSITVNQTQETKQRKDKEDNVINYTVYKRDVSVEFLYKVVSSRTNMEVGSVTKRGTQSASAEQPTAVTSEIDLAKRIVDSQLSQLRQDIIPTIVSTNRQLMNETSKDKAVKDRMKEAQTLVKSGDYVQAIRLYDEIGTSAAQANAGILREAIASDSAAQAQLAALRTAGGPVEKAVKGALDALYSKLPSKANIMIVKGKYTDRDRLDDVVDRMDKTVVQEGKLILVERSNLALINAEQQYQVSGYVSDDSIVSIGKQLGAQYIVLCEISGQMSNRRLILRVLNVETAQVIEQKDFEI